MQALIISFDSLAANSLGCYGNEWVETPHGDRLAATGAVFDRHFVETLGPRSKMAWVGGGDATEAGASHVPLGELLKSAKICSQLITSGPLQDWQQEIPFDKNRSVQGHDGSNAKPDETPFAEVVKAGISVWNDPTFQTDQRLMWLHSAGPGTPPAGFDSLYFEDFEERGQQISELSDEERSRHPSVYAGAVSLIDHWIGTLLNGIEASFLKMPTMVIVMAGKGHLWQSIRPPNSHQTRCHALGDQLARTPLILKTYGDDRFKDLVCLRSDRLVQTGDLVPTLVDWFRGEPADNQPMPRSWLRELTEEIPPRSFLVYDDGGTNEAVRTSEWLLIRDKASPASNTIVDESQTARVSLFVKPEDIWDVNNIATQQPEIVADLVGKITNSHS